jgi:hypothetical protein
MGLARPYFDRNRLKGWTHDQLVDAYVGARTRVMQLEAEVQQLRASNGSSEDWHCTGQPTPYKPADGQW